MNLYLALIGIISTISCVLIIICINSKSVEPSSMPSEGSKSPLPYRGLTDSQKTQILLIVCLIFFLSLLTTNVKTSKFSVIFHNLMASFSQQTLTESITDLKDVFYGLKGKCEFKQKTDEYPHFFKYLKETEMEQNFLVKLYDKNFQEFSMSESKDTPTNETDTKPRLLIVASKAQGMGADLILPQLSENVCKSSGNHVPTVYLDLDKKVQSEQQLMNFLKIGSYDTLKQSICKLNGIEISKQVQKIGSYLIEKQTYTMGDAKKTFDQKVHLIINNYHFLNDLIIFSHSIQLKQGFERDQAQEGQIKSPVTLKPEYQLFIDKLINDLVKNCQMNLVLHTNYQEEVSRLYQNWKLFASKTQTTSVSKQQVSLDDFPFNVKLWKGFTKFQLFELIKEMVKTSGSIKEHENTVWKLFEKSFGRILNSGLKSAVETDYSIFMENNEQIALPQIETFFAKVSATLSTEKADQKSLEKKISRTSELKEYIAEYYGLETSYEIIKTLSNAKSGQKQVSIGTVKRKVSLADIKILEQKGLIRINQGKLSIIN